MKLCMCVVGLIVLYLYGIMPRIRKRPNLSVFHNWYYAHRGFHNNKSDAPENSIKAFSLAVQNNYGIELDIQLTKDNQVVVFHDFDLTRICDVNKKICELNYEEIQKYCILRSTEKIPLFSEVLKIVDGKVPIIVELKCKNKSDNIAIEADAILQQYDGVYCVESFHPLPLLWYKKNRSDVIRGQLADIYGRQKNRSKAIICFFQSHLIFNFLSRPDFIAYNHKHKHEISMNICRKIFGALLVAWTIESEKDYNNCKKYFDLFIFQGFHIS